MAITFDTTTDIRATGHVSGTMIARIRAAVARARERREYRQMLELEDHVLSDIGLTRADIRAALHACGGR